MNNFSPIVDTSTLVESVREMTRIQNPKGLRGQKALMKRYMRKYSVPKGYEETVLKIVQDESEKIKKVSNN